MVTKRKSKISDINWVTKSFDEWNITVKLSRLEEDLYLCKSYRKIYVYQMLDGTYKISGAKMPEIILPHYNVSAFGPETLIYKLEIKRIQTEIEQLKQKLQDIKNEN